MKRLAMLGVLILWVVRVSAVTKPSMAPDQSSRRPASATTPTLPGQGASLRNQTGYDLVLGRFNRESIDYSKLVERERQAFLDARLKNPYFWYSLCTTIAMLLTGTICAKIWADHRRAMWITAEMMADLYSQDAYSRQVAREAIDKYNIHMDHCNRVIEAAERGEIGSPMVAEIERIKGELACTANERDTAVRERDVAREELRKKSEILAEMSLRLEAFTSRPSKTGGGKPAVDLQGADARLVTHINKLQEQLYVERNHNRRLRGG